MNTDQLAGLRGAGYEPVCYGGWRGFAMTGSHDPSVVNDFVSIGAVVRDGRAHLIHDNRGRTAAVMTVHLNGCPIQVYVKEDHLEKMGVRKLIKDNLQLSRPWKTWQRTLHMQAAGVPVQRPIAVLMQRQWGIVRKAVYVGEYLPHAISLAQLLRAGGGAHIEKDEALALLAKELRTMHDKGFTHGDLKPGNILIERRAAGLALTFIDLEGVTVTGPPSETDRAVDLGRLWLSLVSSMGPVECGRLVEQYAGIDPPLDGASLRRRVLERFDALQHRLFDRLPAIAETLKAGLNSAPSQPPRRWLLLALGPPAETRYLSPLLGALRRGFPSVQLDVLVNDAAAPLLAHHPDLHGVMALSGALTGRSLADQGPMSILQAIRRLRERGYEVAIDLTDSVLSALLTRMTGAPVRIGYRTSSILSKWIKRVACYNHMIMVRADRLDRMRHYLLHVGTALGLDGPVQEPLDSETPEELRDPVASVHQGSR